jgi:hypothetical protein
MHLTYTAAAIGIGRRGILLVTLVHLTALQAQQCTSARSSAQVNSASETAQNAMPSSQPDLSHAEQEALANGFRLEKDLLGREPVPTEAYYGVQTQRALNNFHLSGVPLSHFPRLVEGLALVKAAAAEANHALGYLETREHDAIQHACARLMNGDHHDQFVVDMIQGGGRHLDQHECQRGDRQPRAGISWLSERGLPAPAPQQSRQHGAVHE